MNSTEEIISKRIQCRGPRFLNKSASSVQCIVAECCKELNIAQPTVIYCDTLTKGFSAFYLHNKPFLFYDSSLIEILFIISSILYSGAKNKDVDKLLYKLFAEELLKKSDLLYSMYFVGKYNQTVFTFDESANNDFHDKIIQRVSVQNYFLIAHELSHLSLHSSSIPPSFRRFVQVSVRKLAERNLKFGRTKKDILEEYSLYFLDVPAESFDDYMEQIMYSERFQSFIEECYCDFVGVKLLLEQYENGEASVVAISSALNFLLALECIRSDLDAGIENLTKENVLAKNTMFFALLREQLFLLTLQINNLNSINNAFEEIHNNNFLTDRLGFFIKNLPNGKSMRTIDNSFLPKISEESIRSVLINQLYYCHVA